MSSHLEQLPSGASAALDPPSHPGLVKRALATLKPRPTDEIDPLGMPVRLHYWIVVFFSLVMSIGPLLISFTPAGAPTANPTSRILMLSGIFVVAPFYYCWGHRRKWKRDELFYHSAAFYGNLAMVIGSLHNTGILREAMTAALIATPVAIGYVLSPRAGLPHVVFSVGILLYFGAHTGQPESTMHVATGVLVIVCGWLMVALTKARLVAALDTHRKLSETDALTGAYNVRRLQSMLDDAIARSDAGDSGFSLIELDLDDFKQTNDRYSHSMGDATLVATVAAIKRELEPGDAVLRRGGDEFSIIAPDVPGRDINEFCGRLGAAIAVARSNLCPDVRPTASIAFAEHHAGESARDFVLRVDQNVHAAKAAAHENDDPVAAESRPDAPILLSEKRVGQQKSPDRSEPARDVDPIDPIVSATAFAWKQAAVMFVVTDAVLVWLSLSGRSSIPLTPLRGTIAAIALGLAPVCWWMSNRRHESRLMTDALSIGAIAVLVGLLAISGAPGLAGAELLLIPIFFQMYLMPARTALLHAGVTLLFLLGFLIYFHYELAGIRFTTDLQNVALCALLIAFARQRTIETARENMRLARIDALTGLPNVRELRGQLEEAIACAESGGGGFALLMFDLDDFKRVNDSVDHSHGDDVLVAVAATIARSVRAGEIAARRGGDEFAVILHGATVAEGRGAIERIGAAIEHTRRELDPAIAATASFGCIAWHEGDDVDDLLRRVDQDLHESKQLSRVERHSAGMPVRGLRLTSA